MKNFDIRNHVDKLVPSGKKNKFICPQCQGNDLEINFTTGAYNCFNGCEIRDVREAIAPWAERQTSEVRGEYHRIIPRPKSKKVKSAPIPPGVKLLTLKKAPNDIPVVQPLTNQPPTGVPSTAAQTHYFYSEAQWVVRYQWENPRKIKGFEKTFRQFHRSESGFPVMQKGDNPWPAYKVEEVLQLLKDFEGVAAVLWQEGEKVVEIARSLQIASLTLQGSAWSVADIKLNLSRIKDTGTSTVQVFLADPDSAGQKKAKDFSIASSELGIPFLVLYPEDFCALAGDKNDLEQIVQTITPQDFIDRLNAMLQNEVNNNEDEKLKLDLLCLFQETDPIKKVRKRAEICSYYRLSKPEVEELQQILQRQTQTKEVKVYSLAELFALESEGLQWVIPELLPKGETIVLAGSAKTGKTILAIDAAFAIATGESEFLGFTPKKGKVLFVSCDESLQSTRNKLLKRGFRDQDDGSVRILPAWTIDNIALLEQQIEDFRPDVVIIDSLKRITHGSAISENSAEFADNIYTLKELFAKYGVSGILIHHTNKNDEATGVDKIRGSSAIVGSTWGAWILEHVPVQDPNNKKKLMINPKNPNRVLSVFSRDCEGQLIPIQFDPENNGWEKINAEDDSESLTVRERILKVLALNPNGLSGREIIECMGMDKETGRGVYTELNRLVSKLIINCYPCPHSRRVNIYSLPPDSSFLDSRGDSLSPTLCVSDVDYTSETIDIQELDNTQQDTQQTLNKHSTTFSENHNVEKPNLSTAVDTTILNNIDQMGGGESVTKKPHLDNGELITLQTGEVLNRDEYEKRLSYGDLDTPSYIQEKALSATKIVDTDSTLLPGQRARFNGGEYGDAHARYGQVCEIIPIAGGSSVARSDFGHFYKVQWQDGQITHCVQRNELEIIKNE